MMAQQSEIWNVRCDISNVKMSLFWITVFFVFLSNRDGRAPRRAAHPPNSAGAGTQGSDPYREQVRTRVGCCPPRRISFSPSQQPKAWDCPGSASTSWLFISFACHRMPLCQTLALSACSWCLSTLWLRFFFSISCSSTRRTNQVLLDLLL